KISAKYLQKICRTLGKKLFAPKFLGRKKMASRCLAYGGGLSLAKMVHRSSFMIRVEGDDDDDLKDIAGFVFEVDVRVDGSKFEEDVNIRDLGNGRYYVTYSIPSSFQGSSFTVMVKLLGRIFLG